MKLKGKLAIATKVGVSPSSMTRLINAGCPRELKMDRDEAGKPGSLYYEYDLEQVEKFIREHRGEM